MASNSLFQLLFDFKADRSSLNKELKTARDDIKWFNKRLGDAKTITLKANVGKAKAELDSLRKDLIAAKKSWNFDLQIQVNSNIAQKSQEITQRGRELRNYLRTGNTGISVFGKNIDSINQKIGSIWAWIWGKLADIAVSLGLWSIIKDTVVQVVSLADSLEKTQIAFTTMLGSEEKAIKLLWDLTAFAKKTPFEITGIRDTAKQLLAMGIEQQKLIPTLKALGDVSAWLSVPLERLALAYGQVMAKGKLQWWELKQFTEAWVPLIKEMSKQLWVSEVEFYKLVEAWDISASQVEASFQRMSAEGGQFANLMEQQSATLSGVRSNFKDLLTQIWEEYGGRLLPALKDWVAILAWFFDQNPDTNLGRAMDDISDATRLSKQVLNEFKGEVSSLTKEFRNGEISAEDYMQRMDELRRAIELQDQELKNLQDSQERVNMLNDIGAQLTQGFTEAEKKASEVKDEYSKKIDENNELLKNGSITTEENRRRNAELYQQIRLTEQWLSSYSWEIDSTRVIMDALAWSEMTAAQTKAYLDSLKISNGGDISRLNAEQTAAYRLGEEYVIAYKKKLLMANVQKATQLASIANSPVWWLFDSAVKWLGFTSTTQKLQKDIDANNKIIQQLDQYKSKAGDVAKTLNSIWWSGTGPVWGGSLPWATWSKWWWSKVDKSFEIRQKALEDNALKEIQAVKATTDAEEAKAKKIIEINKKLTADKKKLDDEKNKSSKNAIDVEVDGAQDVIKSEEEKQKALEKVIKDGKDIAVDAYDKIGDAIEKSQSKLDDYADKISDINDKFKELRDDTTKALDDVNRSLLWLDKDKATELADRYAEVVKSIDEINAKSDKTNEDQTEINRLMQERDLLMQNTTELQRDQAVEVSNMTDTQKILKQYEEDKLGLLEKQKVLTDLQSWGIKDLKVWEDYTATYVDALGKVQKITDEKTIQFAQDQLNKELSLAKDLEDLETKKLAEEQVLTDLTGRRIDLENQFNKVFNEKITEQKNSIKTLFNEVALGANDARISVLWLIEQLKIAASLQGSSSWWPWFASGWYTANIAPNKVAWVVHWGEWVAPKWMVSKYGNVISQLENARTKWFANGWYTSSTDQSRNININWPQYFNSEFDFDIAMQKLKWRA